MTYVATSGTSTASRWFNQSSSGSVVSKNERATTSETHLWATELATHVLRSGKLAGMLLEYLRGCEVIAAMVVLRSLEIPARRALGSRLPVVHVFGGSDGRGELDVHWRLDAESGEWEVLEPLPGGRRSLLAAAPLGSRIYVVGGFSGSTYLDSVEVFSPELPAERCWAAGPPLLQRRGGHALAAAGGKLYACGGRDGGTYLSSVECFTPRSIACGPGEGKWKALPDMQRRRCYAFARQLGGHVLVCGGMEHTSTYLDSVEQLDTTIRGGSWQPGPSMSQKRAFACGSNMRLGLCICGGTNLDGPLATVECLAPGAAAWQALPSLAVARTFASATLLVQPSPSLGEQLPKRLMVFGGFDGKHYLESIETFNEEELRWEPALPLQHQLIWSTAAAVEGHGVSVVAVPPSLRSPSQQGRRSTSLSRGQRPPKHLLSTGWTY